MQEVSLGGKTFISVKRAAEITGYTRDYLGQLARGGKIESQRVGRSWYVNIDSLSKHQDTAASYEPTPPEVVQNLGPDVIVSLDGLEYISSKRASQISQYSQDYVTQLARAGKIRSKSVGGRWFIAREELLTHKKASDEALARAQIASVGLQKPAPVLEKQLPKDGLLTYAPHPGDLLPRMSPVNSFRAGSGDKNSGSEQAYVTKKMFNNIDISDRKTKKDSHATFGSSGALAKPVTPINRTPTVVIRPAERSMPVTAGSSLGLVAPVLVALLAVGVAIAIASSVSQPQSRMLAALSTLAQRGDISLTDLVPIQAIVDALVGRDMQVKNNW